MNPKPLRAWITHVFDHPADDGDWYFAEGAVQWSGPNEEIPLLVAETFERSGELLSEFSPKQLERGLWYLVGESSPPDFMATLTDPKIPNAARLRALRSFVPLFEQVMASRCKPGLPGGDVPLNGVCFMWWDLLRFNLWYRHVEGRGLEVVNWNEFHSEMFTVMRRILEIPHDACRESVLHGIGHLARDYPERCSEFSAVIDELLANSEELRPELVAYAERARAGTVQ